MKTDQNSNMQGTLNKRISMKKRRNAKRALLALNLVAVIFTTTVFSNPVSVLSEEVSTDTVQSIENSPGTDAQIAEQADVQQNTAEAAQAVEAPAAEAPAAENSAEAAKAEEPSGVNAPAENAMSAEMNAAEDGVVSTDDGASSASAVQSADTSSASNGSFEDAGAGNTDGTKDGIIENDAEGLNEAEGTAANEESEDAASQEQLTYEDEHVKISVSYTDGRAFTADSILTRTYLDSDEKNAVLSAVNAQISKGNSADTVSDTAENTESSGSAPVASTTATTVEYSVAGFHALMLAAKNQDGSDTTTEGDVTFSAEFKKGLNDAGYASREETTENNEAGGDGSLTTTTTRCETSWKIYTVTEKNLTDITDITDAHNTHYEMDENGTLKSASFRGALPQTVAFVQIVKKTVTETTTQKETEKATEKETQKVTEKYTEKITGKAAEKTTETETEKEDVKAEVPASAAMPAVAFDQKVTTENGTVMVHIDAEEGAFEEGTSMTVTPVTRHDILDKAIDAAGGKGAAAAMDITFTKADGTKTEPLKPIHVKMISPVLNHAEEAHVVHVADSGTIDVVARKSDGKTIESTSSEAASSDAKNAVSFESDSFSVYAIVYTVDFEYTDPTTGGTYYYSLKGGESINLIELLVLLGIKSEDEVEKFVAEEVENVEFSNPELVKVTHNGKFLGLFGKEDWKLESLQPFDTEETLTISLENGEKIVVKVTDAQHTTDLNQLIESFTVTGAVQNSDGSYTVKPGVEYSVSATFQESESTFQFSDESEMVFTVPNGITLSNFTSPFSIPVNDGGMHFTVEGNIVRAEGNKVYVKFNSGDPNFNRMKAISTANITLTGKAKFDKKEGQNEYEIPGGGTYKVDTTADVNIEKSGDLVDFDSGLVKYKLTLNSNGENDGITVTDQITGTALTLDHGSVVMKDSSGKTVQVNPTYDGNKFTLQTGHLANGAYTIEYTAHMDVSKLHENQYYNGALGIDSDTKNTVTWDGDHHKDYSISNIVTKPIASKGTQGNTVTDDQTGIATTTWVINAYSAYKEDWRLKNVTDTIKSDGVKYTGTGITVEITDVKSKNPVGNSPVTVTWQQMEIDPETDTSWTYDMSTLPGFDNRGHYWHYKITYQTKYDASNIDSNVTIKNEETTNNDPTPHEGTATVQPTSKNRIWADKSTDNVTAEDITWEIKLGIPAKGLSADKAYVIEDIPHNDLYRDNYLDGSFVYVRGNLPADGTPNFEMQSDGTLKISWPNGFAASPDGNARQIVFRIKTQNNQEWMDDTNVDNKRKNKITFNGEDKYAEGTPVKPTFEKVGSSVKQENGELYYDFDVIMNTLTKEAFTNGAISFTDTFDSHLEYVANSAQIYGGNDINQINQTHNVEKPAASVSGNQLTFNVQWDNVPRKWIQRPDGSWGMSDNEMYTFYKLHYRMKVSDSAALATEALGKTGYTITMNNTITSVVGEDDTTVDYTPKILDKEKIGTDEHGRIQFKITVNEIKADLEKNSDVLILKDTLTNLSVHYHDIEIVVDDGTTVETTDESGKPVTAPYFNMSGDEITFYLPDNHKVEITYYAKPVGEVGEDGKIHYVNKANLNGYEKTVEDSAVYSGEEAGAATNYAVKLLKVDGYVNSRILEGAKFKLYIADEIDEEGNIISGTPMKMPDGTDYVVTTNAEGEIEIKGDIYTTGWNLKPEQRYYLLEVEAPANCAIDNTKYQFIISQKGYVNYSSKYIEAPDGSGAIISPWTYYNGDVLTVKNYPKKGELELTKTFKGVEASELDEEEKAAIRFVVYKQEADGSYSEIESVGYDEFISESYTIGDLEAGIYKVVEIVNDDACKEIVYSVSDASDSVNNTSEDSSERYATVVISEEDIANGNVHELSVKNTYEKVSEFKVYKYANYAAGNNLKDQKLANAEFGVFEYTGGTIGDQIGENYVTNSRGRFSIIAGESGVQYSTLYCVKEVKAPEGYKLSENEYHIYFLADGETSPSVPDGTIVIPYKESHNEDVPNDIGTTSIGVEKIWLNNYLEPDETKTDPVKVKIKRIASYDKAGNVVEQTKSGYYPNGALTFDVVKVDGVWKLQTDTTLPSHLTINEEGKLTGLPSMEYLPNGAPLYFKYEVEEVDVQNYTPSYEYSKDEDGDTIATISNKPNSVKSTTKVKAEKKWVDLEGNDVTDSMGYNDKVDVEVMRCKGVVKAGKIKENGGVEKDPADLFAINIGGEGFSSTSKTNIICLPGDTIRVVAKASGFLNNKTLEGESANIIFARGERNNKIPHTVDSANSQYVCEFTVTEEDFATQGFRFYYNAGQITTIELEVENVTATENGRTQVLTQEEAEAVNGKIVQTLTLEKRYNWKAESKELSLGSGNDVYSYYIVEPKGKGFEATYTFNEDSIIVTNVDKKLKIDKKWLSVDGETEIEKKNGTIVYDLYQVKTDAPFGPYTGEGNISLDYSHLNADSQWNHAHPSRLTGNAANGGIKAGSTVKIEMASTNQYDGVNESLEGQITVTGCTSVLIEDPKPNYNYEGEWVSRTRTIIAEGVEEGFSISGTITTNKQLPLIVEVISEPTGAVPPTEDHYKDTKVGKVTVTYSEATMTLDEAFTESGIRVTAGATPWSAVISKLPETGDNNETYTYYLQEESIEGFDLVSIEPNNAPNGSTILVKNKAQVGSVKVTKAFSGLENLPDTFKITANYNDGTEDHSVEFTVANKTGGQGTASSPYEWTIGNLPVGTVVTFIETGYTEEGYQVTVNGTAAAGEDVSVTATAAKDTPGTAEFTNTYAPQTGELKVTKTATKLEGADDAAFTFEAVLTPASDITIDPTKIIVSGVDDSVVSEVSKTPEAPGKGNALTVTFTVTGSGTASITGIPVRTTYVVTEPTANMPKDWKQTGDITYSNTDKTITLDGTDTVTVTNTQQDFEFEKQWYESETLISWPVDGSSVKKDIKVTIGRKYKNGETDVEDRSFSLEYTIGGNNVADGSTIAPTGAAEPLLHVTVIPATEQDKPDTYKFSLEGLDYYTTDEKECTYFVKETEAPEGFKLSYYKKDNVTSTDSVGTGGTIVNKTEESYVLPTTGGFGTMPFYTIGLLLIAFAGGLFTYMNRKKLIPIRSGSSKSDSKCSKNLWRRW